MDLEKQIDERVRVLNNPKEPAAKRREAAHWLGEVAAAKAISVLARVYKNDRDATVKAAAADALGVFKALEVALAKGDSRLEMVTRRIEAGKVGRPLLSPRLLSRLSTLLVLVLVLLIAANVAIRVPAGGETPGQIAAVASKDRATLLAELRAQLGRIQADTVSLQTQFTTLMGGGTLACSGFFNDPAPFAIAPEDAAQHPDLAAITDQLNAALSSLSPGRQRFIQACPPDSVAVPVAEVGGLMAGVVQTLNSLPVIEAALNTAEIAVTAVPPTVEAAPPEATSTPEAPEATATPETPPTATEPGVDLRGHLGRLYNIVDELTGARGSNTILEQRWREAATGNNSGCTQIAPTIPNDYSLTDNEAAAAPTLKQAVDQINLGLAQARQGWQLYANACAAGSGAGQSTLGLQVVNNANDAIEAAQQLMDGLQTSS